MRRRKGRLDNLSASRPPASFLKYGNDIVLLDPDRSLPERKFEVVVPVLLPKLPSPNEVIEVERVEPTHMRRIDQVPRAPEDRHPQPQHAARRQNPETLPQPRLRHQMKVGGAFGDIQG